MARSASGSRTKAQGTLWRLLQQAGLEYGEPFRAYEERITRLAFAYHKAEVAALVLEDEDFRIVF
jgi:hypothetical protein